VNEDFNSLPTPNEPPPILPKSEAPEPKPTARNMPRNPDDEEPVKGCFILCLTCLLLSLGVWKLVELIIIFCHWV
jgi:hypothetical protein